MADKKLKKSMDKIDKILQVLNLPADIPPPVAAFILAIVAAEIKKGA